MNSGSWSSWQAALPPEARAGGEPDDLPQDPTRQTYYVGAFKVRDAAEEWAELLHSWREVGPGCAVEVIQDVALVDDPCWVVAVRPEVPFKKDVIEHMRNHASGYATGYQSRMRAEKGGGR